MRDLGSRNHQDEKNEEELGITETTACKQSEEGDGHRDEKNVDRVEIVNSAPN